jgi:hypothetical protein
MSVTLKRFFLGSCRETGSRSDFAREDARFGHSGVTDRSIGRTGEWSRGNFSHVIFKRKQVRALERLASRTWGEVREAEPIRAVDASP